MAPRAQARLDRLQRAGRDFRADIMRRTRTETAAREEFVSEKGRAAKKMEHGTRRVRRQRRRRRGRGAHASPHAVRARRRGGALRGAAPHGRNTGARRRTAAKGLRRARRALAKGVARSRRALAAGRASSLSRSRMNAAHVGSRAPHARAPASRAPSLLLPHPRSRLLQGLLLLGHFPLVSQVLCTTAQPPRARARARARAAAGHTLRCARARASRLHGPSVRSFSFPFACLSGFALPPACCVSRGASGARHAQRNANTNRRDRASLTSRDWGDSGAVFQDDKIIIGLYKCSLRTFLTGRLTTRERTTTNDGNCVHVARNTLIARVVIESIIVSANVSFFVVVRIPPVVGPRLRPRSLLVPQAVRHDELRTAAVGLISSLGTLDSAASGEFDTSQPHVDICVCCVSTETCRLIRHRCIGRPRVITTAGVSRCEARGGRAFGYWPRMTLGGTPAAATGLRWRRHRYFL